MIVVSPILSNAKCKITKKKQKCKILIKKHTRNLNFHKETVVAERQLKETSIPAESALFDSDNFQSSTANI